jgi:hypothetical protein
MSGGNHKTIVLSNQSKIVTRWNDSATVILISSSFGDKSTGIAARYSRYSRVTKKYMHVHVPQLHMISQDNKYMFDINRFYQNNNHMQYSICRWKEIVLACGDLASGHQRALCWHLHKKPQGIMKLLASKKELVCTILRETASNCSRNRSGGSRTGPLGSRSGSSNIRYDNVSYFVKECPAQARTLEDYTVKCVTYCGECNSTVCTEDCTDAVSHQDLDVGCSTSFMYIYL